jgi:hypothetical protein
LGLLFFLMSLSPISDSEWQTIELVSVTYYHKKYDEPCRKGETASGMRCVADAHVVALGPKQLQAVRDYYGDSAGFPLLPCFDCSPIYWGQPVRLCNVNHCQVMHVVDTGSDRLEVDLPRQTWCEFGYTLERGRFDAILQVRRANE